MNVAQKHRVVIHKKFIQSFSIKENILFAVVTNVLPTPPGESTLSVSTTPNQYADICLYTTNLPDAVTGCHSNSDAMPSLLPSNECRSLPLTVNHILLECSNSNSTRQRFFGVSSLNDLFDNTDNHVIIDIIKKNSFYAFV